MFETPILFIVFNRPDIALKTFNVIRLQKPKYLFIAADGPRIDFSEDLLKCEKTRKLVLEQIDWDCDLKILFREENRGCGYGPAEAISWFFNNVEEGIILEDDCLPHPDFFNYASSMLHKYRDDQSIYMISGFNPFEIWRRKRDNYILSILGNSLGWASWGRAWKNFDYDIVDWKKSEVKKNILKHVKHRELFDFYSRIFDDLMSSSLKNVWDYQWLFTIWANNAYVIVPTTNLIKNIGFNNEATHTFDEKDLRANLETYDIKIPLNKGVPIFDKLYDWMLFQRFTQTKTKSIFKRFCIKFYKFYTGTN